MWGAYGARNRDLFNGGGVVAHGRSLRSVRALVVVALIAGVLATTGTGSAVGAGEPAVRVLSNRADLVSGGDALVEVVLPEGADPSQVSVDVDGTDVSDAFALRADGRVLGLVSGLVEGTNVLTALLPDGRGATIEIDNHPIGGPVFSGPQVAHWRCTTDANGLGAPIDDQCNAAAPLYEFFYMPADGSGFAAYDPEAPPDDVGTTTTDSGETVPFIIRQETGAQNRGIYRVAVLYRPGAAVGRMVSAEGLEPQALLSVRSELRDELLAR